MFTQVKNAYVIYIANIVNPYNNVVNVIINSNNSLGDQKFDSPMNGGTNYINSGSGFSFFFEGKLRSVMWSECNLKSIIFLNRLYQKNNLFLFCQKSKSLIKKQK